MSALALIWLAGILGLAAMFAWVVLTGPRDD